MTSRSAAGLLQPRVRPHGHRFSEHRRQTSALHTALRARALHSASAAVFNVGRGVNAFAPARGVRGHANSWGKTISATIAPWQNNRTPSRDPHDTDDHRLRKYTLRPDLAVVVEFGQER